MVQERLRMHEDDGVRRSAHRLDGAGVLDERSAVVSGVTIADSGSRTNEYDLCSVLSGLPSRTILRIG